MTRILYVDDDPDIREVALMLRTEETRSFNPIDPSEAYCPGRQR